MSQDSSPAAAQPEAKPRRRWLQFSLRTLLLLVGAMGLALLAWRAYLAPYLRQCETIEVIEKLGGTCQTVEAPAWLRFLGGDFQNILHVDLAGCDEPDAYLDHVGDLPVLELLIVGGPAFTDEHAQRLHGLTTLQGLILDSTSVTDEGLAAARAALPTAEVYRSQRRLIAALATMSDAPFHVLDTEPSAAHASLQQLAGKEWFEEATRVFTRRQVRDDEMFYLTGFTGLKTLFLGQSPVTSTALKHLQALRRLESLDLDDTQTTDEDMAFVGNLTELRTLALRRTPVTDAGLQHLANLTHLRDLYLNRVAISDAGLECFGNLKHLLVLDLQETRIRGPGLAHFNGLSELLNLDLSRTPLTDAGVAHVGQLRALRFLDLNHTEITDAGLPHLRELSRLESLNLDGTRVTGAGLEHLTKLSQLVSIGLGGTRVTDAGVAHLREMTQLRDLNLSETLITDAGLEYLKGLKNLAHVELAGAGQITASAVAALRKALPVCTVETVGR